MKIEELEERVARLKKDKYALKQIAEEGNCDSRNNEEKIIDLGRHS